MKALVLGLGISGKSAVKFLKQKGYSVVEIDDRTLPVQEVNLNVFDLFVPSPGIPRTHPLYQKAKELKIPIAGEAELALRTVSQPCIGITGTNGKTTVVKMIEHCLNFFGKKAKAVGNVGDPLAENVNKGDEILVVELSSYQLETVSAKVFDIGVILNIAEDHLDRYDSFEDYAKTKSRLQYCIKENGKLFVQSEVNKELFSEAFHQFNGENEEAASLVCAHFGIDQSSFDHALSSFVKPPHRLEFVTKIQGVAYFNDSKATNVAAVVKALNSFRDEVVLIAGGLDKGLCFDPLCSLSKKLSCVIVFGQAREKIANALQHLVDVYKVETVQEAVQCARHLVKKNGTVLFSPGCASFDEFANYADRGEAFKRFLKE